MTFQLNANTVWMRSRLRGLFCLWTTPRGKASGRVCAMQGVVGVEEALPDSVWAGVVRLWMCPAVDVSFCPVCQRLKLGFLVLRGWSVLLTLYSSVPGHAVRPAGLVAMSCARLPGSVVQAGILVWTHLGASTAMPGQYRIYTRTRKKRTCASSVGAGAQASLFNAGRPAVRSRPYAPCQHALVRAYKHCHPMQFFSIMSASNNP